MIERLSAPSETRDKYLATPPPFSAPREGTNVQIAGFRIQAYSDHTAAVVVAIKNSQGGLGSQTLPLKWVQGDWKVDLSSFSPLSPIDDMADFVPWSGV
ncbi:hypothetical protein ASG92_20530 [Arthrobacter sp. Soil736]|uniref:hypothetical protein n=1 Tax=Arthrobacter sp. Soil736 TaxID=1736395 RepID=UPI0006F2C4CF|nr:hypothetical protein [Arthrobacter sp. Soil736]KRE61776.1 hypothetical protein ASG92_20530 [Arthrobacter sp. Soil736]